MNIWEFADHHPWLLGFLAMVIAGMVVECFRAWSRRRVRFHMPPPASHIGVISPNAPLSPTGHALNALSAKIEQEHAE